MKVKKHFYLHSVDGRCYEKLTADDLMRLEIPRSTAYRAIAKGTLPSHRLRELQLKFFGDLPGWDGWKIMAGKIVSPAGHELDQIDLENLAYLQRTLWRQFGKPNKKRNVRKFQYS